MADLLRDVLKKQAAEARKQQYDDAEKEAWRIIDSLRNGKLLEEAAKGQDQATIQIDNPGVRERVLSWLMSEGLEYRVEHGRVRISWR